MDTVQISFNRHVIKPAACYRESWSLIRGQYWLFFALAATAILLSGLAPLAILLGPMMCGYFLCLIKKSGGQAATFGTLFEGFNYFVESLIATMLMVVPMLVIMVPMYLLSVLLMIFAIPHAGQAASLTGRELLTKILLAESPVILGGLAAGMAFALVFFFVFPLIVDKRLKAIDAIKTSARAGMANLGGLLALVVTNMVLGAIGVALCYVGVFFILPITMTAQFVAYRQVFGEAPPVPLTSEGA